MAHVAQVFYRERTLIEGLCQLIDTIRRKLGITYVIVNLLLSGPLFVRLLTGNRVLLRRTKRDVHKVFGNAVFIRCLFKKYPRRSVTFQVGV